jgi:hypothetical protein
VPVVGYAGEHTRVRVRGKQNILYRTCVIWIAWIAMKRKTRNSLGSSKEIECINKTKLKLERI